MKRVRSVFVGRSWGLTQWREEAALAASSTELFVSRYARMGGDPDE